MAKAISQYFKRIFDDYQVLVMINPTDFTGIELIVHPDGKIEKTEAIHQMEFQKNTKNMVLGFICYNGTIYSFRIFC